MINRYLDTLTTQDLVALQGAVTLAEIDRSGDVAQVTLRYPKDGDLHLTMSRNPENQSWQVISVSYEDIKELVKKNLF